MPRLDPQVARKFMIANHADPLIEFPGGAKPWLSVCLVCGEQITPRYANVKNGHKACKFCSGKAIRDSEPLEICKERNLTPIDPYPGKLKAKWKCKCNECGDIVFPMYGDLKRGQGGCLRCSYKLRGENQSLSSEVAFESMINAGAIPLEDYPGSVEIPWLCRCTKCGELATPRLHSIRSGQGPCIPCGYKTAASKIKNSEDKSIVTMYEAGFQPLVDYPGAGVPWLCVCLECRLESSPTLANVQNGTMCRFCSAKKSGLQIRLPEEQAIEDMRRAGLDPIEAYPGSSSPWKVQCMKCERISSPRHAGLKEGKGCRFCSRERVTAIQLLPQEQAIRVAIDAGLEPLEAYSGRNKPWKCRCVTCGNVVTPALGSLLSGQGGCVYCGRVNQERNPGTILYLIQNKSWMAYKIGVGNQVRLTNHTKKGWQIVRLWQADSVQNAYKSERLVLVHVREELGLPRFLDKSLMPQGGFSETFSGVDIPELKAIDLVQSLAVGVYPISS